MTSSLGIKKNNSSIASLWDICTFLSEIKGLRFIMTLEIKILFLQVATFGCEAFALLFDDIEPELSEADRSAFQSFGLAQVSLSNEVFEHLNQPKLFLFCPTGMLLTYS